MTDEQKFMTETLKAAVKFCGDMLAEDSKSSDGVVSNVQISASGVVESGPLHGRRVRLTFGTVD